MTPLMINLASQPFRRERAQNAIYAVLCGLLTCSLIILSILALRERSTATDLRRGIDREQMQLNHLKQEQAQFTNVLARPQNADVFAVSVFLNELIARRSVSWMLVFKDLETVMPQNMQLVSIRLPQVPTEDLGGTNHIQLEMQVGTLEPQVVVQLLTNLAKSPLFGDASITNQQPPKQNDPFFHYAVTVAYAQKL